MHMIGTNICVWLHVLIQETKHQIMTMISMNETDLATASDMTHAWDHVDDVVEEMSEDYLDGFSALNSTQLMATSKGIPGLHRARRSLNDHYITHSDCRRSNIIGELVTDASQFLFPCTIEYSLICAAILYIMWKGISEM